MAATGLVLPAGAWTRWNAMTAAQALTAGLGIGDPLATPDRIGMYESIPFSDPVGWEYIWCATSGDAGEFVLLAHFVVGGSEPPVCVYALTIDNEGDMYPDTVQRGFGISLATDILAHVRSCVLLRTS
jgi:hypothetical protein